MSIKISWTNVEDADSVKLYRSSTKFGIDTLPAVYQTFTEGEVEYIDTNVVRNQLYYYMVEKITGGDKSYTPVMARAYYPDSGPGATEPIKGDWSNGYFGAVADNQFFTPSELLVEVNSKVDGGFKYPTTNAGWRKFIFDGKIVFIPILGITTNSFPYSWDFLYDKGLVYGIDGFGFHPTNKEVNQEVVVTKNGFSYKVRLMKLTELENGLKSDVVLNTGNQSSMNGGEAGNTFHRVFYKQGAPWVNTRYDNEAFTVTNLDQFIYMELNNANNALVNTASGNSNIAALTTSVYTTNITSCRWMPVLELMITPS